jgi:hypothetical protein
LRVAVEMRSQLVLRLATPSGAIGCATGRHIGEAPSSAIKSSFVGLTNNLTRHRDAIGLDGK